MSNNENEFAQAHNIVVGELNQNPDVWIGETKEYSRFLERFQCLEVPEMCLIKGIVVERLGHIPRYDAVDVNGQHYWITLRALVESWTRHDGMNICSFP